MPTSEGHSFLTIQYFATKICSFTKFKMLFGIVAMDFPYFKVFQIFVITLKVYQLLIDGSELNKWMFFIPRTCFCCDEQDVCLRSISTGFHLVAIQEPQETYCT